MQSVQGDYVLKVRLSGYSNPLNTCYQCATYGGGVQGGCCDSLDTAAAGYCEGYKACDNEFFYCLMPLENTPLTDNVVDSLTERDIITRADQLGCLQPPVALRSDENDDGGIINFSLTQY